MAPLDTLAKIEALLAELRISLSSNVVTNESELAAALLRGGSISVAPGVYTGNFSANVPVVLDLASNAELVPGDLTRHVLQVNTSGFVMRRGIVRNGAKDRDTIVVGDSLATDAKAQPTDVVFDTVVVQAGANGGHRGFALHGRNISVTGCTVKNFWESGRESQAIWINNGPGPYQIENNFLEASGENILLGGASLPCGLNPSATIRGNILTKQKTWKGTPITIKNIFEIKSGVGVVFEGNRLENCWGGQGQAGTPIVLTPRNQSGDSPWVQVADIHIVNNIVQGCPDGYAVNILGSDNIFSSMASHGLRITGNYFADTWAGLLIGNAAGVDLFVDHNTFLGVRDTFLKFYGPSMDFLSFNRNVARTGSYGIHSDDGTALGQAALIAASKTWDFSGNVIEQSSERNIKYPATSTVVPHGQLSALLDSNGRMLDASAGW